MSMKKKVHELCVRTYLGYKKALSNAKGSPTLEYVVIIAAGAAFAGLLVALFGGSGKGSIGEILKKKLTSVIQSSANVGGGKK